MKVLFLVLIFISSYVFSPAALALQPSLKTQDTVEDLTGGDHDAVERFAILCMQQEKRKDEKASLEEVQYLCRLQIINLMRSEPSESDEYFIIKNLTKLQRNKIISRIGHYLKIENYFTDPEHIYWLGNAALNCANTRLNPLIKRVACLRFIFDDKTFETFDIDIYNLLQDADPIIKLETILSIQSNIVNKNKPLSSMFYSAISESLRGPRLDVRQAAHGALYSKLVTFDVAMTFAQTVASEQDDTLRYLAARAFWNPLSEKNENKELIFRTLALGLEDERKIIRATVVMALGNQKQLPDDLVVLLVRKLFDSEVDAPGANDLSLPKEKQLDEENTFTTVNKYESVAKKAKLALLKIKPQSPLVIEELKSLLNSSNVQAAALAREILRAIGFKIKE
ncbi:MAG: hypothetical protein SGI74_06730 [Oligoflexia bacterium]|nr:hypothetical protein [Oligoflexia bacterium]